MPMIDPTDALVSFQAAHGLGQVHLDQGSVNGDVWVHIDQPNGALRLTYVTTEGSVITALAMFVSSDPVEGLPCFNIGYAVPEAFRGQGKATALVNAAIDELRHGLGRNGIATFYVEAVVSSANIASQRVAQRTLSPTGDSVTDGESGEPALHYMKRIGAR